LIAVVVVGEYACIVGDQEVGHLWEGS